MIDFPRFWIVLAVMLVVALAPFGSPSVSAPLKCKSGLYCPEGLTCLEGDLCGRDLVTCPPGSRKNPIDDDPRNCLFPTPKGWHDCPGAHACPDGTTCGKGVCLYPPGYEAYSCGNNICTKDFVCVGDNGDICGDPSNWFDCKNGRRCPKGQACGNKPGPAEDDGCYTIGGQTVPQKPLDDLQERTAKGTQYPCKEGGYILGDVKTETNALGTTRTLVLKNNCNCHVRVYAMRSNKPGAIFTQQSDLTTSKVATFTPDSSDYEFLYGGYCCLSDTACVNYRLTH